MDELIGIDHLTFTYPHTNESTLENINLKIFADDFLLIAGDTGSGKTTLLSHLKKELMPNGHRSGYITFQHQDISKFTQLKSAQMVGFVSQNPRNQPVMATVIEELAFSLENIGCPSQEIGRRVAELSNYLGLDQWLHKRVDDLSGGQLQIVNLASVLILRPKVILLDEPTAQLDPLMTQNFMTILSRIHQELGMTIVMTEHNLAVPITMANRMVLISNRQIAVNDTPAVVISQMFQKAQLKRFVPEIPALFLRNYPQAGQLPLSVSSGQRLIHAKNLQFESVNSDLKTAERPKEASTIVSLKNVSFTFDERQSIVDHLSLDIHQGDWLTIVGKNGSGKSTLLSLIGGLRKPQHGRINLAGKTVWKMQTTERIKRLSFLSQEPSLQFGNETVFKELMVQAKQLGITNAESRAQKALENLRLTDLENKNPFDLSGGQQQLLGLAIAMIANPQLLVLDEPTNGLDPNTKHLIGEQLLNYQHRGGTIIMATHDMAFAAAFSGNCGFMFDGRLESILPRRRFFSGNFFFTTALNRLLRDQVPDAILVSDVRAGKGGAK
ncbi:ABC transporter ATP-binding protein [Lentilactobacillus hilgardii]|uniref:ABC transporter, ATP-binding protein n=1 Tax=Lentilactobacillus hilgardii (strain ATCC 8290 / DSM 20176 / CCUG 30140 / JCM 1155 / KCTC 3500 / NBRC 15886 / NCIMB 8040 / NRRL B-1843 / 9) TaxID=1423757 RepID=C0XJF4_LENH9|nr:ABC transporter ATP-binding protein [Lentilactobacillus hilgardii]EEI24498.1 ABC transporter, ATP-binding protein [Lentilactobacillus hilgardii DSM 20176 = ATCC 8290]KRK53694.1 metal ion ABC superfamily ATP binding cassette transporter ATPase [Lentilactobacillus hilgardii DSM 20176 = ATCC 8290]QEU37724.1 ATP-binding cassette domain-containing protein [Lentilactobacillus hilgardii]TDG85699.1 hypothetical protein C5L34_001070 [Lentilactobacillus hilgardii]